MARIALQTSKLVAQHAAAARLVPLLRERLRALEDNEPVLLDRLSTTDPNFPQWLELLRELAVCTTASDFSEEIVNRAVEHEQALFRQITPPGVAPSNEQP
jgi:hypothetical protein